MDRFTGAGAPVGAPAGAPVASPHRRPGATIDATSRPGPPEPRRDRWFGVAAVGAAAAAVFVVSVVASTEFPLAMKVRPTPQALAPGLRWLESFSWWDGAWYVGIAERGYGFMAGPQSPTAFFPAYPMLIRLVAPVAGGPVLAGFLVSLASGLGGAYLFYRWALERLPHARAARVAQVALLLYPCSFYLFGVLYADSLFLLTVVAAFLLLERDRPVLAGLCAAVATATRPIGLALAVGLLARALERRSSAAGVTVSPRRWRAALATLERRDAGLLLAPVGLVAYAAFLWSKFGDPLYFLAAEKGWGQSPGWQTWLKVPWLRALQRTPYLDPPHYHLVGNFLAAVIALTLAVLVFRRLGWGYGIYSFVMVFGAAMSTKNFIGTGRYAIAAFPCFAVAGLLLAERRGARRTVFALSGALLFLFTELHARNMLIS